MAGVVAGRASVILTGDSSKLNASLAHAKQAMTDLGASMQRIGQQITGYLIDMTNQFGEAGDKIAKAARRTGIATEDLSALGFVAERSGASLKDVEIGVRNMSRAITESQRGMSTYTDLFKDLGLNTQDLEKMDQSERFAAVGEAIANLDDPAKQASYAMRIFGRSGTMLLPIFQSGSKGIKEMVERAKELGVELSGEMATNAEALVDAQTDWKFATIGLSNAIGNALAPALTEMTKLAASWLGWVNKILRENKWIVTASYAAGAAIAALGTVMTAVAAGAIIPWGAIGTFFTATLLPALAAISPVLASVATTALTVAGTLGPIVYIAAGLVYGFDNVNKSLEGVIDKMLELAGATTRVKDVWAGLASLAANSRLGNFLMGSEMRKEVEEAQDLEVQRIAIERNARGQAPLSQKEIDAINDRVARDIIEKAATVGEKDKDKDKPNGGGGGAEPAMQVPSRSEIIGTFSARGAQGMSTRGSSVLEDNSKKQTEYLKKIADKVENVGLLE